MRSRILLLAAEGRENLEIAAELKVNRHTPALWRQRFIREGLDAVWEIQSGRGRKPHYPPDKVAAIVDATLQTKPKGATHWSCRTMARSQQVSKNTVNRIWQEHNLKPHLSRTFKLSRDPRFLEKLTDVVGLYLNPPDKTLVFCVDEKSQIQALDRTQPGLPLKKGRCGTFTHDYVRHGTTTLFAALEILEGKVIGQCYPRHRHQEFLKFLRCLDDEFADQEMDLHLVMDNYGTHKHPKVQILATAPSPLRAAFHSDQFQLAQSSGAVVWRTDPESGAPGSLCQRGGITASHCGVLGCLERSAPAVCLDGDGGKNHGENKPGAKPAG